MRLNIFITTLSLYLLTAAASAQMDDSSWRQFRGNNRDGRLSASQLEKIYSDWPSGELKVLWQIPLTGAGYSSPSVADGRAYIHDYDPKLSKWIVRCLSMEDGRELWQWSYKRRIRKNHGMTRTAPVIAAGRVFSLDPKNVLHCIDANSGEQLWEKNLVAEFTARIPPWYAGQCPLFDGERLILGIGGKDVLMAAFNADGSTAWTTPNPDGHMMSHSSPMPATIDGVRQYIWCTLKGLVCVAADDGRLLWSFDGWTPNVAVAPSALTLDGGKVFMSAGYKAGAVMLQISQADGKWSVKQLFTLTDEQFNTDTQTAVVSGDGAIIAVDHFDKAGRLAALSTGGEILWRIENMSFGLGNFVLAGENLLAVDGDSGTLHVIKVSADSFQQIASYNATPGHEVWAPIVIVDGKLLIRNLTDLYCLDIGRGE